MGEAGGGWPGSLEDVRHGVAAAHEYVGAIPLVIGHSAGGHLALKLAAEDPNIKAVIALAPVAVLQLAEELNLSNGRFRNSWDESCTANRNCSMRLVHPCNLPRFLES